MQTVLLIGTRKGAFTLRASDEDRAEWEVSGPVHLGHIVHHMVADPRDRRTVLIAARTGHLGPTVFRSADGGASFAEATRPPAFPKSEDGSGRSVAHVFYLTPGHASEPGVWYAGASPHGLFRSEDGGATWEGVAGFNEHPRRLDWSNRDDPQFAPPGGATTHSIIVDPRDRRHMYLGLSTGGVFESTDQGADWRPLNRGCRADFLPNPDADFGHDPHCVRMHPLNPDRLYQQNHFGLYRIDRPATTWTDIGQSMPSEVGDTGFPIELHPRDTETAWIFPMDGTTVWPRVSPGGRPAVYVTRDAGASWQRQDSGLPSKHAYWNVKRQGMTQDGMDPLGVYFGTTNGEVWGSFGRRGEWRCLAQHLPEIYSLEAATLA